MKIYYTKLFFILLGLIVFSSCKGTKKVAEAAPKAFSPAGAWEYMITGLPDGDQAGTMMLTKTGDALTGKIMSDAGEVDLEDLVLEGNTMTSTFTVQGYDIDLKGSFVDGKFKGNISAAGYEFPITATRKP